MDKPATKPRRRSASDVSSVSAASTEEHVGATFGDFHILRKLGHGGMGEVYLAEQVSLKRKVALKMLRGDVAANATALARFQAESTTIAKLNHANIVQAYTVGEHDGRFYLAMEYVEGFSLREYMTKKGALEVPLVLSIMRQVASGLQRASEMGIIHRDIKPENILLTRKAEAKVADFGLSQCLRTEERVDLTRAGATVGTPLYMSPEQIEGKELDCRSDIYSFGVTCYHMLAGQPPFEGSTAFVIATKHVREEPPALEKLRPDLPPALCEVVRKMMAKKPAARYATARELLHDIVRVRQSLGSVTQTMAITVDTPADEAPTVAPPWQRPVWLAAAAGVALLALFALVTVGVAAAWFLRPGAKTDPDPRTALAAVDDRPKPPDAVADPTESLKKSVDQILKESSPTPAGVETCIDLGVLYLDKKKTGDAEALFKRMTERRPPSAYYLVGRLGLAVTDALHNDHKASRSKLTELFDAKAKDNRAQILNDYLTKKPEFAVWVNEADSHNVRNGGAAETSLPKFLKKPPSKFPFRK